MEKKDEEYLILAKRAIVSKASTISYFIVLPLLIFFDILAMIAIPANKINLVGYLSLGGVSLALLLILILYAIPKFKKEKNNNNILGPTIGLNKEGSFILFHIDGQKEYLNRNDVDFVRGYSQVSVIVTPFFYSVGTKNYGNVTFYMKKNALEVGKKQIKKKVPYVIEPEISVKSLKEILRLSNEDFSKFLNERFEKIETINNELNVQKN